MKESHEPVETSAARRRYEDKLLLVLTLIIGAVVSLAVVAFILLTENLGARMYPAGAAAWRRVLIPLLGALSTGVLLYRYFPNARGSGIPQTKAALFLRDGYIAFRTVLGKFGLCSVSLASGIALGREGPAVQVGAGIASVLGRRLGLSTVGIKALVPAGASAALAAAFNTPISAVLFTLEEVMGDMHAPVLGSVVLSSATSWIVLHLLLGDEPLFHVPAYQLVHPVEFIFYAVLGVVGGLVSVAFVKLLLWQRKQFSAVPANVQWCLPAVGGLTVGLLGWFFPQVLGVGYTFVGQALNGQILVSAMALLVCLKLLATATCYASGNAGGIFGPSLFIGAMMGGAVGGLAHSIAPDYTGGVGAYALVGMGAAFAGIVRAPMTSVIMIFEITRDYSIIVPLMIANLISYFLSSKLQDEPIYEALQHQDGIHLPSAVPAPEVLLTVANAFHPDAAALAATERIQNAVAQVDRNRSAWPVVDVDGFRGMVTATQLDEALAGGRGEETLARLVPAPHPIDLLTSDTFPHVHPDHPLALAMRRMAGSGMNVLPVVSRNNIRNLEGTLSVSDIVAAYGSRLTPAIPPEEERSSRALAPLLGRGLAVLAVVMVLTGVLNYFYRSHRTGDAEKFYQSGAQLLAADRYEEAVEQLRKALSISHSTDNRLMLGLALSRAGHLSEASSYLREVLRERPQSGPANLEFGRLLARQGHIDEAVLHYDRAANGAWQNKLDENRLDVRFELVQMLAQAGKRDQAEAALTSLAAQPMQDVGSRLRLARMLADFGMLKESGDVYRAIVQTDRQNASAYAGLGDIEFRGGDCVAAQQTLRRALQIDSSNKDAARKVEVCSAALALDPTMSGLPAEERFRRSELVLRRVIDAQSRCGVPTGSDAKAARAALARRNRPASYARAAESDLALVSKLWQPVAKSCHPAADDPLSLLMAKLAKR